MRGAAARARVGRHTGREERDAGGSDGGKTAAQVREVAARATVRGAAARATVGR